MTVEPRLEREALDRTPASCGRVDSPISDGAGDRLSQGPGLRRLVPLESVRIALAVGIDGYEAAGIYWGCWWRGDRLS